jgi:subtilisin family serine protease
MLRTITIGCVLMIASAPAIARDEVVAPELSQALAVAASGEHVGAYLVMTDQLARHDLHAVTRGLSRKPLRQAVAEALKAHAARSQQDVRAVLDEALTAGTASRVETLWMGNAVVFSAERSVIEQLAGLPGVDRIRLQHNPPAEAVQDVGPEPPRYEPPTAGGGDGAPPPEPNLVNLQAPDLWALGINGDGALIGNIDSGVFWEHPDLINRIWTNPGEIAGNFIDDDRNGKVDDVHGWDFISNSGNITSGDSHGTRTAGIVLGDGSTGIRLTGMAPGASMVGCEVSGEAQYWLAQQYCLEVGVDAITSSYSYKWLFVPKPDYHMHRQMAEMELAAGIIHANSIGNQGNLTSSYPIPFNISTQGNCPPPFAHPESPFGGQASTMGCGGILLPDDTYYSSSGKGPAAWEDITLYDGGYPWAQDPTYWDYPYGGFGGPGPGIHKPDVLTYTDVWSTTIGGGYSTLGGTSGATPHLGGAMCLMIDAQPEAQPRHIDAAIEFTAIDLGPGGKDNTYGSGKVQVFDAARRLRILGRADDQFPAVGGSATMELFGYPNALVFGWFGTKIHDRIGDFNMMQPYFALSPVTLDGAGQGSIPLIVPNQPALDGVTVWFQFGAQVDDAIAWGNGPLLSVPEWITIGN